MTSKIYQSFLATKKVVKAHHDYPTKAGIYALFLTREAELPDFNQSEKLIYIGIAKQSLHVRDFAQHFRSGKSGSSTLRRSLGAILKNQLNLTAIPRGGDSDSKRFENYKFTEVGEQALTKWMEDNLEIGYWMSAMTLSYKELRDVEKSVTMSYMPVLDLDNRTRKYNKYAEKLDGLRKICKFEARNIQ